MHNKIPLAALKRGRLEKDQVSENCSNPGKNKHTNEGVNHWG